MRDHLNRIAAEYESAKIALDRRYICQHPLSEPHIRSGNRVRTHALIQERAARAAQGLKELGIGEGDAVALLLRNDFESFEASAAAAMVDSYTVPINWHATAEEVCFILRDCAAKCLIVHRDLLDPLRQALPPELPIIAVATPPEIRAAYNLPAQSAHLEGMLEWEGWIRDHAPLQSSNAARRAAVIYTSGTTGRPKGVRRAPSTVQPNLAPWGLEIDGPVRVLINGPLYHSAPLSFSQACFRKGATIVLQPRFDAEEMLAFVERYQISHMHVVPTMFVRLLRLSDETKLKYDLSSLRYVVHGAAPCPPEIKQAMIAWWGPIISEYYGSTETSLVTWHDSADALRKPGTVGRALPEVEIAILDEHGNRLPQGESGEIFVNTRAGPPFTYIGNDEALAEVSRGSFVTVGDVGFLDQDGFLFLRDRKRDMIISGGVNIYSAEIEAAILTLAGVKDCAVFGIPDPEFGEAVCAHVQPTGDSGLDADTIKRALGERLSRFKIPKVIRIVDSLPREDSGKVFKRKLRELHAPSPM
ncbi:MAG TPA: AMP-binding protein [Bradyrhizobium sp.]|nr:AMP-binding protein [Bradyrhizobium sp.]